MAYRRGRATRQDSKLVMLVGICAAILLVLLCVAADLAVKSSEVSGGGSPSGGTGPLPALSIDSVVESGEMVDIHTSYCDLQIPYAFSDLVKVRAVNDGEVKTLQFYMQLNEQEYSLFDLIFNGTGGIRLGDIKAPDRDSTIPVFAKIGEDENLVEGENRTTYLAARDCFNDVVVSLNNNKEFTPLR